MKIGDKVVLRRHPTLYGETCVIGPIKGATGVVAGMKTTADGWKIVNIEWDNWDDEHGSVSPWNVVDQECLFYNQKADLAQLREVFNEGYSKVGPFDKIDYALQWVLEHYDLTPRR